MWNSALIDHFMSRYALRNTTNLVSGDKNGVKCIYLEDHLLIEIVIVLFQNHQIPLKNC